MDEFNYCIKRKNASVQDITEHLELCDNSFIPALSHRTNISEYSLKLFNFSITFEAWHENILVGLIAVYFNDDSETTAFISSVSTLESFSGKGIAKSLLTDCIQFAKEKKFKQILLEVDKENVKAISLYKTFGFVDFQDKDNNFLLKLTID
jgi:ribosomal protein S18 acetylase RimI-like enzyme